ncbi:DUF4893 domain-containing protein [Sphingomonas sp. TDK1]|uniref:DUF4893 domain-containing protein n=1 Tax=Sphingomonas sp. TDK1 TaxID=453247 RepID=UPI0007D9695A|nr:DUF4893 domain-containing protein [Sphingomonas sp. TDK1]OAN63822.1 DUF4893 domain-containing protein [Sphingomonas sp. TDK1]
MMLRAFLAIGLGAALAGCSVYREATSPGMDTSLAWRRVATDADRNKLRDWRKAWSEALPLARAADAKRIDGDPELFDPDRAQPDALPPAGAYRCRVFKLGGGGTAVSAIVTYDWRPCLLADQGKVRHFRIEGGVQRPEGNFFPDVAARAVFLGTLEVGDDSAPLRYGLDRKRDMIGYGERIGDKRWRLVIPYPAFESKVDVIEIVPAV